METAPRENVDTDELLDESVVRAFTAKARRGGFGGGGKRDVQRRAQQERFRRAVAQKDATDVEPVEDEAVTEPQCAAEVQEPKRRRGAHFKAEQGGVARDVQESVEAAGAPEEPVKKAPVHAVPDAALWVVRIPQGVKKRPTRLPLHQRRRLRRLPSRWSVSRSLLSRGLRAMSSPEASSLRARKRGERFEQASRRRHRGGRGSNAESVAEQAAGQNKDAKTEIPAEQPKRQPVKGGKPERSQKGSSAPKQERNTRTDSKCKSQTQPKPTANDAASQQPEPPAHGEVSAFALARVLGRQLLKVVPTPAALSKIKEQQTQIVKVEGKDGKKVSQRTQHNEMSNRKIAEEIAIIQAWIEQNRGADTPVASRRQRAYQIFNDEKAFDGKHGERLIRRMTEKGISMQAIKVAPNRPVHFTGFFTLGADKPFIMVENLDTYDEIVKLLRGRKHAKLFGTKVGGVIFGGGCKASVSHALDDYLAEIGYRFNYVYYVGDIDREGARIVEQARNANVVEIRLHAGMYRAMLAEHKRRVKAGGECEPAAANQGVPQNLAATIKDLPMVTRVQFRNVLREGGRIPQEILMTADYRDGDSGSFDRMLNN